MSSTWILICFLIQEAGSFMIYNSIHSLCLQDSPWNHTLQLEHCDLNADLQQWLWKDQQMLENKVTRTCLSSQQDSPVLTAPCDGSDVLLWQCQDSRLMNRDRSLELTTDGSRLFLARGNKLSKWKSIEIGDICKERQRPKRASDDSDHLRAPDDEPLMTLEQREFLRWYYRTEDTSSWRYAMLALSYGALLIGCGLLVTGLTNNRNRKQARVQATEGQELQKMTVVRQVDGPPAERHQSEDPTFMCGEKNGLTVNPGLREEDV
ncbi:solute carrier family 51 subunit beta [Brienomyrus brachyistius]|uniref:solute carrier family 51 subunit beta n=1 Tax=Brienomyrus brachyistius TaxID=42636 RepID=UPI0020B2C7E0|nr:solute carrier family 51 subunit beta [Brienomyrus brachyistius]